jgi:hypothetical protein
MFFDLLLAGVKIVGFLVFILGVYKSAQYYQNRAATYEDELLKDITREERRKRAVEHFERIEKQD